MPGVNRLWLNGLWSQKDNFLSVPTDCPQRDERLGWMGDAQVFLRTATYNMDVAAFFTKWMMDVEDAQTADGIFPDTAPRLREGENFVGLDGLGGAAGWADAGIIVPWTIWRVYGDRRIIERHWSAMVKWLDWIERHNPGRPARQRARQQLRRLAVHPERHDVPHAFADEEPAGDGLLGGRRGEDGPHGARSWAAKPRQRALQAMFEKVRAAFQKEWLREDGRLAVETQTAYLLALAFDLLPENVRAAAADHLVENIQALDWHLSTGFIGISHLNPQLTLTGHATSRIGCCCRTTYPSWLYPVRHGATTIWERWNGWTEQDGFFNAADEFVQPLLARLGRRMAVPPRGRHRARSRRARLPAVRAATVHRRWARLRPRQLPHDARRNRQRMETRGQQADVERSASRPTRRRRFLCPARPAPQLTEGGVPVDKAAGLRVVGRDGGFLLCEAVAGSYTFTSTL